MIIKDPDLVKKILATDFNNFVDHGLWLAKIFGKVRKSQKQLFAFESFKKINDKSALASKGQSVSKANEIFFNFLP